MSPPQIVSLRSRGQRPAASASAPARPSLAIDRCSLFRVGHSAAASRAAPSAPRAQWKMTRVCRRQGARVSVGSAASHAAGESDAMGAVGALGAMQLLTSTTPRSTISLLCLQASRSAARSSGSVTSASTRSSASCGRSRRGSLRPARRQPGGRQCGVLQSSARAAPGTVGSLLGHAGSGAGKSLTSSVPPGPRHPDCPLWRLLVLQGKSEWSEAARGQSRRDEAPGIFFAPAIPAMLSRANLLYPSDVNLQPAPFAI